MTYIITELQSTVWSN